jgi:hypothetical protein
MLIEAIVYIGIAAAVAAAIRYHARKREATRPQPPHTGDPT